MQPAMAVPFAKVYARVYDTTQVDIVLWLAWGLEMTGPQALLLTRRQFCPDWFLSPAPAVTGSAGLWARRLGCNGRRWGCCHPGGNLLSETAHILLWLAPAAVGSAGGVGPASRLRWPTDGLMLKRQSALRCRRSMSTGPIAEAGVRMPPFSRPAFSQSSSCIGAPHQSEGEVEKKWNGRAALNI